MHLRNKLRLLAGIPIDHTLEVVTEAHKGDKGDTVEDKKTGKDYEIKGSGKGSGPEEKYTLKDKTGKTVVKKAEELRSKQTTTEATANIADVQPKPDPAEDPVTTSSQYKDGDLIIYNNGVYVVVLSDPKTDMVGIIPVGLINASAAEKNRSVEMCKPDPEKFRKPTREEIDAFKMSTTELKAVDDDMSIEFSADGGSAPAPDSNVKEVWDIKAAEKGGKEYAKGVKKVDFGKKKKLKVKKGTENEEGCMAESTHNYSPGNKQSHTEVVSDPINVVGQGDKQWANSLDPKEVKNEYTLQVNNRGEQSMSEENEKVKVPNDLKSALKQAIKEFEEDAKKQGNTHTGQENAQLFADTAAAFQKILDHLNEGSIMDIKHAQIFAQTLMGPMLHKLPDGVWDFLANGGQKRSLKDYMNGVKEK